MKHLFFLRMVMMLSVISSFTSVFADSVTQNWIEANYQKQEFMIPMRDGVRLYTAVYSPRKISDSPLLLMRTPYSCGNYGSDYEKIANNYMCEYLQKGYIYVKQDVRGRFRSEGVFEHIKPVYSKLRENGVDEATDVYDTVEWLLNNLSGHNGRVGILGNSYSGFYALMGGLSDHPAIKAISPQAPVVDWFVGDDFHQNGALKLIDAFHFHNSFGKPHYGPTERYPATVRHYTTDEYSFFLQKGPLPEISSLLGDSISFWPDMM
ncbi:MAG: CocE/NonD family hydrolase, partial [Bacteroidales bacterium]